MSIGRSVGPCIHASVHPCLYVCMSARLRIRVSTLNWHSARMLGCWHIARALTCALLGLSVTFNLSVCQCIGPLVYTIGSSTETAPAPQLKRDSLGAPRVRVDIPRKARGYVRGWEGGKIEECTHLMDHIPCLMQNNVAHEPSPLFMKHAIAQSDQPRCHDHAQKGVGLLFLFTVSLFPVSPFRTFRNLL